MRRFLTCFWLLLLAVPVYVPAQDDRSAVRYEDHVYVPDIRTVQLYKASEEQSLPVIELGSGDELILSFDDLGDTERDLYYTIEHCTAEWKSSNLPEIQYLDGFPGERITDYRNSSNTYLFYRNYTLRFPNFSIKPLISGNYLLKVYEDNDPQKLVLTRRFYVYEPKVSVGVEVTRSSRVDERNRRQKLDLTLAHGNLQVSNPAAELKLLVSQNNRADNAWLLTQPQFVRSDQLVYNDVNVTDFYGGNEFRRFDLRSLRFRGEGVRDIQQNDIFIVMLDRDPLRTEGKYGQWADENGRYYTLLQDGGDPSTEADYARVLFNLAADPLKEGDYYVLGQLTDWQLKDEFRLSYDPETETHQANVLLKQGIYNYMYVYVSPSGEVDALRTEGSHFETENEYTVMAYYRRMGSRYDELVGVQQLRTR